MGYNTVCIDRIERIVTDTNDCAVADTVKDSIEEHRLSEEGLKEIYRLIDSVDKYGLKEGVRRFHKDTMHLTDEEVEAIKEAAHEIVVSINKFSEYEK